MRRLGDVSSEERESGAEGRHKKEGERKENEGGEED